MSQFEAGLGREEDNEQLQKLYSIAQPTRGVHIAFERSPSYFQSEAIMYNQGNLLLVKHKSDKKIAAAVNMGVRSVYVNSAPQSVHYGADMRIGEAYQGSRALLYINREVKSVIANNWYQSIILSDNTRSKDSLENNRAGLPFYRKIDDITTYHITRLKQHKAHNKKVRIATHDDIQNMNNFVKKMASSYQFLPCYDFNELTTKNTFYNGLKIEDFLILEESGELTGLIGLWDQSHIKQARIISYHSVIKLVRPIHNFFQAIFGGVRLPKEGELLKYICLHSPLTAPENQEGFSTLLSAAWEALKKRGFSSMTLTLSTKDPRKNALKNAHYSAIDASHYSVAYDEQYQPVLAKHLINYYECGRL